MLIIGVIAASSSFMFSDVKDGNKLIREEADNFALWLTDRMSRRDKKHIIQAFMAGWHTAW